LGNIDHNGIWGVDKHGNVTETVVNLKNIVGVVEVQRFISTHDKQDNQVEK